VGADIASICQKASLLAIREFLERKEEDLDKLTIEKKYFMEALRDAYR
jgi:transitional endoplasmic reticulum ATPase